MRVLGSYPSDSQLVGPVKDALAALKDAKREERERARDFGASAPKHTPDNLAESKAAPERLKIGIIGFKKQGQYLAKTLIKYADVFAIDDEDLSHVAAGMGVSFFPSFEMTAFMRRSVDVVLLSVSPIRCTHHLPFSLHESLKI